MPHKIKHHKHKLSVDISDEQIEMFLILSGWTMYKIGYGKYRVYWSCDAIQTFELLDDAYRLQLIMIR